MTMTGTQPGTDWGQPTLATYIQAPGILPEWSIEEDLLRVEEYRDGQATVVRADLPGVDPACDVEVQVSDGTLRIDAQRRRGSAVRQEGYLRREVRYGFSSRTLPLPPGSGTDATVTYDGGVLEVRIPLAPPD